MKELLAVMAWAALNGCAFPQSIYNWKKTDSELPHSVHIIPQSGVQAYCGMPSFHVMACAYRDYDHCYIVTAYSPLPAVLLAHEKRHCAGWSHQSLHTQK